MRQDLRYTLRTLRRSPGFTAAAVLCIALGIGANTAIFSLVEATLLRSLPVHEPQRLATVHSSDEQGNAINAFSYPQFGYMRAHSRLVRLLARTHVNAFSLSAGEVTDTPSGELVSDTYFSILGVQPELGRGIAPGDENVLLLSHRFWKSRLGGDRAIVGRIVSLNGLAFTVIGVTPPPFFGMEIGRGPDVFAPLQMYDRLQPGPARLPSNNNFWLDVAGRLEPGAGMDAASAEADVVYHQGNSELTRELPPDSKLVQYFRGMHVRLAPGGRGVGELGENFGQPLRILMGLVALVLLIVCANVAALLLARAAARQREIAVRVALGAGRGRLIRQLLTESLLLALAGGVAGLLLASWGTAALVGFLRQNYLDVPADARVLWFTFGVSVLTGLLFGAAPALQAGRQSVHAAVKGEALTLGFRRLELRSVLVAAQAGISLLLVAGAGLFARTLYNLKTVDTGFHAEHVLLVSLNPGLSRYSDERTRAFFADLLERVASLPGVTAAAVADQPLLAGAIFDGVLLPGQTPGGRQPVAAVKLVTPRFFETMGIALRAGRDFTRGDRAGAPKVAIVNERFARQIFPGGNPLGQRIGVLSKAADLEIVGVIADTKYRSVRGPAPVTVYLPLDQRSEPTPARSLHVRTAIPPEQVAGAIRAEIRALDRNLPVGRIASFASVADDGIVRERLLATLAGFFGGVALLLVSIGVYGVIAYAVERRTREIGIRVSLGAAQGRVVWMVMRQCVWLVLAGVTAGAPAAIWLSRLARSLLFGVAPGDPLSLALACAALAMVAGAAAWLPARRAARVDPMVALRYE